VVVAAAEKMGWGGRRGKGGDWNQRSGGGWDSWTGSGWDNAGWSGQGGSKAWGEGAWSSQSGWAQGSESGEHKPSRGGKGGGRKGGTKGDGGSGSNAGPAAASRAVISPDSATLSKLQSMQVSFCPDPRTKGERFTSTYEKEPCSNFASLNAGHTKFYVGGGTMNKQFAKDLETYGSQDPTHYQNLHNRMFTLAKDSAGQLLSATDKELHGDPNIEAAFVRLAENGSRVGVAFVDVFKEAARPHHAHNVAMVYTVGPQRRECPSDESFLDQVQAMAANVSAACCEYNVLGSGPCLEMLRVCLVSGGDFAGGVPKADVAAAICVGLAKGLDGDKPPVFEFAYDGDVFKTVFEHLTKEAPEGLPEEQTAAPTEPAT